MMYEIFKFEIAYRLKRPETYLFFVFLLLVSIFAVDFVFEGVDLGLVKKNAPIVIAKSMGAYTGIFMILASMIMGVPILRDDQHQITPLLYSTPIRKRDLFLGRYLGSFLILFLVFCAIPLGMMIGEFLPWHLDSAMGPFRCMSYLNSFSILLLPTLFFGGSLFFVTGALSRNLLVVYTQGLVMFVLFMLTKSINNEYIQALLDPFSLTTTTYMSKLWSVSDKNTFFIPFSGVILANKIFWVSMGFVALFFGYLKFSFSIQNKTKKLRIIKFSPVSPTKIVDVCLPTVTCEHGLRNQINQWISMSIFYCRTILKETSFWAIVICAVIIIIINSISLGTVYGVDSYPTTYFIIAELQEMSFYFFSIILLFYSGELYWRERGLGLDQMTDATAISSFVTLSSKVAGLTGVYVVLILALICSGALFQVSKGYYHIDLSIYFVGFFIQVLPVLVLYTIAAFFFQSLLNNKFLGILVTILFIIGTIAMQVLNPEYILTNFASGSLASYSEMNGYGHFIKPYLWTQIYWGMVGVIILIAASILSVRGASTKLIHRIIKAKSHISKNNKILGGLIVISLLMVGGYIYYQTFELNEVWTKDQQLSYRAGYEKQLKKYEYIDQPQIINTELELELFPKQRSYDLRGSYTLQNQENKEIKEIHIQKQLKSFIHLDQVQFSVPVTIDSQYQDYEYIIYRLEIPIQPNDSISMSFHQTDTPKGWDINGGVGSVLHNGTFIRNNEFPTLGYNTKYELQDSLERASYDLSERKVKADLNDEYEILNARSGSDSHGVRTKITIGTSSSQTAISSGTLIRQWEQNDRDYFQYQSTEPIINFYAILSGKYGISREIWITPTEQERDTVALEIYYHPRHTYNLERMMAGMKASLDYYSTHFSPYQYDQLRIVEFPRYQDFAQSFPNTIPFSESIGFMLDIDDAVDVDMTFFVTAHEVAHQWWGMQLEAANVQGHNFLLETLSQYSALMVLKQHYPQDKIDQFLALQQEEYRKGKQKTKVDEVPLFLVGSEEYIYYNKGVLVMNEIQELIGEDRINKALQNFLANWNSKNGLLKVHTNHYATSEDLIENIIDVSPGTNKEKVERLLKEVK